MRRAMLFYVDDFPEKRHHRKESELLFPKLRARTPISRELLDRLDDDHARGERKIREVEHALLAFEMIGESRRQAFEEAVERYVDFYLGHMALEEREILPLAEKVLTDEDWADLDEAFGANRDPLTGCEPELDYAALFTRIVNAVPAPIGLGAALTLTRAGGRGCAPRGGPCSSRCPRLRAPESARPHRQRRGVPASGRWWS